MPSKSDAVAALRQIISFAPRAEPPDRVDPDTDDTMSEVFDAGYKYAMWIAAKAARDAIG